MVQIRFMRRRFAGFGYQDWLLLCFILGVLGGTAAALAFGGPTVQGCILGAAGNAVSGGMPGVEEYFRVLKQRIMVAGAGWLSGITVCSQLLFGILTFYIGMTLSLVLSVLTMQKGLLGITAFLGAVLPHGVIYGLIWYIMSLWSGQRDKRIHFLAGLLLLAMTGAGAFLEVFTGPFLTGVIRR